MAAPPDPKKPPAPVPSGRTSSGELGVPPLARYTGPDPKVSCGLVRTPGPTDQALDVVAHITAEPLAVPLGADVLPMLRGPIRSRLDSTLPPGAKPLPVGGAAAFEMDLAISRFHDRAFAVARVGPGVSLDGSDESTATGLQKVAWKLPRPC